MEKKFKILVVDDNPDNIRVMVELLKKDYQLNAATNGFDAIEIALKWQPDLILLDIMMPEINGYYVCIQLKSDPATENIPIIFVTALSDTTNELMGLDLGAVDYIIKPIVPDLLKARVKSHIELKTYKELIKKLAIGKKEILQKPVDIAKYEKIAETEFLDTNVGKDHINNCVEYAKIILNDMLDDLSNIDLFATDLVENICQAIPYHDIGKRFIPSEILLKPGKLTAEEFEIVKAHTHFNDEMKAFLREENVDEDLFGTIEAVVRYHHERWDGGGYPEGLKEEKIPLIARIMALADEYDTIVNKRVYKEPFTHYEAVRIIISKSGSKYDPQLIEIFTRLQDRFMEVSRKVQ